VSTDGDATTLTEQLVGEKMLKTSIPQVCCRSRKLITSERAQRGIVYMTSRVKITRIRKTQHHRVDVSRARACSSIAGKLMEARGASVSAARGRKHPQQEFLQGGIPRNILSSVVVLFARSDPDICSGAAKGV